MSVTREMWYEWIAKAQGREVRKPNDFMINRVNEASDPTTYKLDLGQGKKFTFVKSEGRAMIGGTEITLDELKKIFNFAKKNGAI